ncbi:MAG: hypothetical protein Q7T53_13465 [Deltaproteobacteria bacterium]|nr:hypothetical protein [Deltaproteobacteria bacterium]
MKTEKGFHCVEFKHEAQMQIYKEIKDMTPEQEIEYFRRRVETGVLGKLWGKLHGESAAEGRHNMTTSSLPHHPHHP